MSGMAAFDYDLPSSAIAQSPIEPRDAARLLVSLGSSAPSHERVCDLPDHVRPGDLLVVNETRVLPARLHLRKPTGGAVEVLLLEPAGHDEQRPCWRALVRPSRKVAPGTVLPAGEGLEVEFGEVTEGGERLVTLHAPGGDPLAMLDRHGQVPLPPYIHESLPDPDRYQTVFARTPRSVAAPTAGLHLTTDVLDRCRAAGAEVATVDLAVGLATFRPVTVDDPAEHPMHEERYEVAPEVLERCRAARRVIAVGTTTVRALESAARGPLAGRTTLFIRRPFEFRVVDALLTNFHLPRSSLLLLLDALIGDRWRELYDVALAEGYRFLSFGDAMLVSP